MESNRKLWNEGQKRLRMALDGREDHAATIELCLRQHAMVHSASVAGTGLWSYPDEILAGLPARAMRAIPDGSEHSIAWVLWHLARIEDTAMNLLVAGSRQVLQEGDWNPTLNTTWVHTGNAMQPEEVATLSAALDIPALLAYRAAVGRRTRAIVQQLSPQDLKRRVDPGRLQRVRDEEAVVEAAEGLLAYWGRRTFAGLLLMPATRHNFVHLNEASHIRRRQVSE